MKKIRFADYCITAVIFFLLGSITGPAIQAKEEHLIASSSLEILLPPDSDKLSWRYNMKMASFTGGCSCMLYELNTPELIDWRITEMKKAGLNTIIVSGFHMHYNFLERWPSIVEYVKVLTQKAHKNGMKVIFHHDIQLIFNLGTGLNYLMTHTGWLQRDIKYDNPIFNGFCLNNPDFKKDYFNRIENLVRETSLDGAMLDDLSFGPNSCGCKYCRERFTQETGLTLPIENDSVVFFNKENPLWIAWLKWRKKSLGDWWVDMRKMLNTVNPDFCMMIYTTHNGFTTSWAPLERGYDIFDPARACDFIGTEIMSRNVYDSYRAVYAFRKAKAGLGRLYGSPIWGLFYHMNDPVYAYFGWAINHMNNQTTWMDTIAGEDFSRYLDWPGKMNGRCAVTESDVAVLFSKDVRDFGKTFPGIADVLGTSQCLSDAHIQHDIIMNDSLLDTLALSKYKLLILPCVGNMSEKEVQKVRQYVTTGGTVFATGHTSLLDENGFDQSNFQLADLMGVDFVKENLLKAPVTIKMNADGKTAEIPYTAMKIKLHKNAKEIAAFINKDGRTTNTAIVSNTYGKGKCYYSAIPLGILNNQPEYGYERKMDFEKNEKVYDFYMSLVKDITRDNLDFKAIKIPEKVLVSVYRQNTDNKKEILIHLLNATGTGSGLKKGDIIPGKSNWSTRGNPFPRLTEDIVFDIRLNENPTGGYIVSPDYKDKRPVSVQKIENGYFRITIKKEDIQAYSIVYLKLVDDGM